MKFSSVVARIMVIALVYLSFLLLTSLAIDVIHKAIQNSATVTRWQIEATQTIAVIFVATAFISLMVLAAALSFQFAVVQILLAFTSKKNVDWLKVPRLAKMYYVYFTAQEFGEFVPKKRWDRYLDGVEKCLARTKAFRKHLKEPEDAGSGKVSLSELPKANRMSEA